MNTYRLAIAGLLIAIGTMSANLFYIPVGISKCFPVQHAINVLAAVLLGPVYAVAIAFGISLLRNICGLGSLLAFPGSMCGAFLAAILYARYQHTLAAMAGEIIGTGLIGGFLAFILAHFVLGKALAAWFFIPPFLISTIGGSLIAGLLLKSNVFSSLTRSLSHDR